MATSKENKGKVVKIIVGSLIILCLINTKFPYIHNIHKQKPIKHALIKLNHNNKGKTKIDKLNNAIKKALSSKDVIKVITSQNDELINEKIEMKKSVKELHIKQVAEQIQIDKDAKVKHDNEVNQQKVEAVSETSHTIPQQKEQMIDIDLSFYTNSNSDCGKSDAVSANGTNLLNRGSNVDLIPLACPQSIPFGTKIYIQALHKVGICLDRGGAIEMHNGVMSIDVFIENASESELLNMGRKKTKGYIIK